MTNEEQSKEFDFARLSSESTRTIEKDDWLGHCISFRSSSKLQAVSLIHKSGLDDVGLAKNETGLSLTSQGHNIFSAHGLISKEKFFTCRSMTIPILG